MDRFIDLLVFCNEADQSLRNHGGAARGCNREAGFRRLELIGILRRDPPLILSMGLRNSSIPAKELETW